MSPCARSKIAETPSSVVLTFSAAATSRRRDFIWWEARGANLGKGGGWREAKGMDLGSSERRIVDYVVVV